MAIWYVDHVNGNDVNNGQSFANRVKNIATIDSSVSAGDTIRLAKSPGPTLVTNSGTVRNLPANSDYYGTSLSGTYSTTTGETNIAWTNHSLETGYTVQVTGNSQGKNIDGVYEVTKVDANNFKLNGYTAPSNGSVSGGYWRNVTSSCVTLGAAVTQTIASTGQRATTWTASTNVTTQFKTQTSQWTQDGSWNEHAYSDEITIANGFGTGKAAYWELPATLDLSGYQQISLKMCQPSGKYTGDLTNGNFSIRLCTDTAGDTSVHTVPCVMAYGGGNGWRAIVKDFGANLNSAIKSVALYVDSDQGSQTIRINNIIACKASSSADSLTHKSLIGLNTTADKAWYAIASIVGTRVMLITCGETNNGAKLASYYDASGVYFSLTSASASIYKREVIDRLASTSNYYLDVFTGKNGSDGNPITISGGWDTSGSMTTQNGATILSGVNGYGYFYCSSSDYIVVEKFSTVNTYYGPYFDSCDYLTLDDVGSSNTSQYGMYITSCQNMRAINVSYSVQSYSSCLRLASSTVEHPVNTVINLYNITTTWGRQANVVLQYLRSATINTLEAYMSLGGQGSVEFQSSDGLTINTLKCGMITHYSGETGLSLGTCCDTTIGNLTVYGAYYALTCPQSSSGSTVDTGKYGAQIDNFTTVGVTHHSTTTQSTNSPYYGIHGASNYTGAVQINGGTIDSYIGIYLQYGGVVRLKDVEFDCVSQDVSSTKSANFGAAYIKNYDDTANDNRNWIGTWGAKGWINSETTTRHTASGYAWKFDTSSAAVDKTPLTTCVGRIPVAASAAVTVTAYIYRSSANVYGRLRLGGDSIGVADVTDTSSGSASSWEQLSAQITPANAGVLEIHLEAYNTDSGGNVIFDDMTVSQA